MTKTREEIIFELLLSLNQGDCRYVTDRVELAIIQYNMLVEKGVINED